MFFKLSNLSKVTLGAIIVDKCYAAIGDQQTKLRLIYLKTARNRLIVRVRTCLNRGHNLQVKVRVIQNAFYQHFWVIVCLKILVPIVTLVYELVNNRILKFFIGVVSPLN